MIEFMDAYWGVLFAVGMFMVALSALSLFGYNDDTYDDDDHE